MLSLWVSMKMNDHRSTPGGRAGRAPAAGRRGPSMTKSGCSGDRRTSSAAVVPDRTSTLDIPSGALIATSVESRSPTMTASAGSAASLPEQLLRHVDARLADDRLGLGACAGLERGEHGGAVGQPAVGGRAERVGVGRHDRRAVVAHRLEGGEQLGVAERAVERNDDDLGGGRVGGDAMPAARASRPRAARRRSVPGAGVLAAQVIGQRGERT